MTTHRHSLKRITTTLSAALASAALIAACSGTEDAVDPAPPGGGDGVEASDGGDSQPSEDDDSGADGDDQDGTEDGTEDGTDGGGDDGSDDGADDGSGDDGTGDDGTEVTAPDPIPLDGYGPGTTALVQELPGVGETISADELTSMIEEEMPGAEATCTDDLEIGSPTQLECPTEVSEISVYVASVNLSAESSDLLLMAGELPDQMLAEAQSEQARTVVSPLSASGHDGQVLRDDEIVDVVNSAFPNAGGAPEYEAVSCRGAVGPVEAGDEYEYTVASCAGFIQTINAATFRVVPAMTLEEAQGVLVTVSLDDQTGNGS